MKKKRMRKIKIIATILSCSISSFVVFSEQVYINNSIIEDQKMFLDSNQKIQVRMQESLNNSVSLEEENIIISKQTFYLLQTSLNSQIASSSKLLIMINNLTVRTSILLIIITSLMFLQFN